MYNQLRSFYLVFVLVVNTPGGTSLGVLGIYTHPVELVMLVFVTLDSMYLFL